MGTTSSSTASVVLGGGFRGTEAVVDRVQGMTDVEAGYCKIFASRLKH